MKNKIPAKYAPFVFAPVMALGMASIMSFFMTGVNTGFDDGFLWRWANAFAVGFCVALPASQIIAPLAQRITRRVVKPVDGL